MTGSSRNAAAEAVEVSARHKAGSAGAQDAGSETRRMIKLSDIRMHDMDVSIPNEKQARMYTGMVSGQGRRTLPPVRVGFWIDASSTNNNNDDDSGRGGGRNADGGRGGGRTSKSRGTGGGRGSRGNGGNGVREIAKYVPPYYLLADGDVYRGWLKAGSGGASAIECIVVECESEADFLTKHALANQRYAGYNPLKVGRIVRWLQTVSRGGEADDGTGRTISRAEAEAARRAVEDVMRACRDTVDQKFINLHLVDEAANVISGMCEWLGGRLSRFELPYYIPYRISKAPPGVQAELAEQISLAVLAGSITDVKFTWPAPEEINMLANMPAFRGESEGPALSDESGGVTVVVPEGEGMGGDAYVPTGIRPGGMQGANGGGGAGANPAAAWRPAGMAPATTTATGAAATAATAPTATTAATTPGGSKRSDGRIPLQNTRDVIIIPGTKAHPPYMVDLKTRRVSAVDEHQKVVVLREVGGVSTRKGAYLMPV